MRIKQTTPLKHTWEYSGSLEELSLLLNNFTALRYASVTSSLALSKPKEGNFKHEKSHIKDINKKTTQLSDTQIVLSVTFKVLFFQVHLPHLNIYSGMTDKTFINYYIFYKLACLLKSRNKISYSSSSSGNSN